MPRCTTCGKRPQTEGDALPHLRRPLVARSRLARHHQLWDGSRRPLVGGGAACCNGTPHQTPRPVGPDPDPGPAQAANRPAGSDCGGIGVNIAPRAVMQMMCWPGRAGRAAPSAEAAAPAQRRAGTAPPPGRLSQIAHPDRARTGWRASPDWLGPTPRGPARPETPPLPLPGQHQAGPVVDRCGPVGPAPRWRG